MVLEPLCLLASPRCPLAQRPLCRVSWVWLKAGAGNRLSWSWHNSEGTRPEHQKRQEL